MHYFEVKLKRSYDRSSMQHQKILDGLGLWRVGQVVFLKDTPPVRGMLYKVIQRLQVAQKDGELPPSKRQRVRTAKAAEARS